MTNQMLVLAALTIVSLLSLTAQVEGADEDPPCESLDCTVKGYTPNDNWKWFSDGRPFLILSNEMFITFVVLIIIARRSVDIWLLSQELQIPDAKDDEENDTA